MAAGLAPAAAVWAAAPGVPGAVHDLAILLALPVGPGPLLLAWVAVGALRTATLVLATAPGGGTATRGGGVRRAGAAVLAAQVVGALPAALVVTMGLTAVPYLLLGAALLTVVATVATAGPLGLGSARVALGLIAALGLLGAVADALPGAGWVIPAAMAGGLGGAATAAVARALRTAPPRPGIAVGRAAVGLLVTCLVGAGAYRVVGGPMPVGTTVPVAITAPAASTASPVLLVDGFNSVFRARPALPLGRPVWGFSYRGLDPQGRLVPHRPADTLDGVEAAVGPLVAQVDALVAAHGSQVTVVGISQGALVARTAAARGLLDGRVERVVLVDLPTSVGYLRQPAGDGVGGWATAGALRVSATVVGALTPLEVRADATLPHEMEPCALPASDVALPVSELRLRSLTDALSHRVARPPGIAEHVHLGAHALTAQLPHGQAAIAAAIVGQAPSDAPALADVARVLHHLAAPWRLPAGTAAC